MQYRAILTNEGLSALTTAQINDEKVVITSVILGDGNGTIPTPNPTQSTLINEVWRGVVSDVYVQDRKVVTTAIIGVEDGSFTIREIGILDANGTLIAVGNYPEKYKPTLLEGMAEELVIEFVIETDVAGVFELQIDPTIALASKAYVDRKTSEISTELTTHLEQDVWLDGTFQNGYTGELKFTKNKHSVVTVYVRIDTIGSLGFLPIIATLPAGFRPYFKASVSIHKENVAPYNTVNALIVSSDGTIRLSDPIVAELTSGVTDASLQASVAYQIQEGGV